MPLGTSFRSLSLSWERKEQRKKNDAYLFLGAKTAAWGTALGRGSILRCAEAELFEMEGMAVANAELGAWNKRKRERDGFADSLSAILRVAKARMEGMSRDGGEGG